MKALTLALAAAVALTSSAIAQTRIWDPAAGNNDPRFIYLPDAPTKDRSAIATNDGNGKSSKPYFGRSIDRFADSKDSPYGN